MAGMRVFARPPRPFAVMCDGFHSQDAKKGSFSGHVCQSGGRIVRLFSNQSSDVRRRTSHVDLLNWDPLDILYGAKRNDDSDDYFKNEEEENERLNLCEFCGSKRIGQLHSASRKKCPNCSATWEHVDGESYVLRFPSSLLMAPEDDRSIEEHYSSVKFVPIKRRGPLSESVRAKISASLKRREALTGAAGERLRQIYQDPERREKWMAKIRASKDNEEFRREISQKLKAYHSNEENRKLHLDRLKARKFKCRRCGSVDHLTPLCPQTQMIRRGRNKAHKMGETCREAEQRVLRKYTCSLCKAEGHNVRTCPSKSAIF